MPGNSQFPVALDEILNPQADTPQDATGFEHDVLHARVNDAILAVQTKLGTDGADDPRSIDFRLRSLESALVGGAVLRSITLWCTDTNENRRVRLKYTPEAGFWFSFDPNPIAGPPAPDSMTMIAGDDPDAPRAIVRIKYSELGGFRFSFQPIP